VAEFVDAVVVLGRAAGDLDEDGGVREGGRVDRCHERLAAHDGDVGERREVGAVDADLQVARRNAAPRGQGTSERDDGTRSELRVGARPACHRVDDAVAEFEFERARLERRRYSS